MSTGAIVFVVLFALGCVGQIASNLAPLRIAGMLARDAARRKR